MNKKVVALIAAALLAVLGVGAVLLYAQGAENRAFDQATLEPVLVVTTSVPAGTAANKLGASVELKRLPKVSIVEGAVTDLADLGDAVSNGPMAPGEQLTETRFEAAAGEEGQGEESATDVPVGMQVVEISLAAPRVPSTIKAGSKIGLIGSYQGAEGVAGASRMFLSNVQVIGVLGGTVTTDGNQGEGKLLRLAVTTKQAQQITNVMEYGHLWVTDQNEDTDVSGVPPTEAKDVVK